MKVKNRIIDTGRRKLGSVLGDNVKTGIGALLMPGVRVGPNSVIGPNTIVLNDVSANSTIFARQTVEENRSKYNATKS
jgi:bifunctional UDP-N-acetylglucosamine pyrophosphorylase/glucosamine-1-phosphate N-acetyltransferase